ncbi:MAG: NAD+ synthase [Bacteroidales bacterium]|nr:NAD+ synthase [Bacteroidales bacterium]MCB9013187.1 NAD+ synthase [Bacteroidales bacterium]
MKIALAQLDYHIGNFAENTASIVLAIEKARQMDAELVVFSELSVCGYPPLDLLERKEFVQNCLDEIQKIAKVCDTIAAIIGGPSFNTASEGKMLFNSAFFLYGGEIMQVVNKSLLPTYDIFDEYRYFEPNRIFNIVKFKDLKIALTICEDLWDDQPVEMDFARGRLYTRHPLEELSKSDPDIVINIAASPFSHTRKEIKRGIFTKKAKKHHLPVLYVNQVGAQTQLIFEGGSMAVDKDGKIISQLDYFSPEIKLIDTSELDGHKSPVNIIEPSRIEMVHNALVTGIKGYFSKMNFSSAVLGLSGGIDSAITLVLAARALGSDNVHALLLPSGFSSSHSVTDSEKLAKKLGVSYDIIGIEEIFKLFNKQLSPIFKDREWDVTEENIQSRIRSVLLMAYSNKLGHILLNTSNKSEAAVGYGTLYGDMSGGLAVLGDVYKTDVYELADFINEEEEIIPLNIITKPPSAELRPDQKDSDSLPEYEVLDKVLEEYIEHQKSVHEISLLGFDEALVSRIIRLVNMNEYKRYQTPPILRISSKAFGGGRRIPIVAKY